ncbi:MAG: hypothetical protein QNJ57_13405 [Flavobacteriaceae bacterium]|nr:hypothetical protein [Flavobacteriaceae bacterium]
MSLNEFEKIEKAVGLYWTWNTDDDPKNAVKQLETFAKNHQDNWLAPYWASYISTQIANSMKDHAHYLDQAQEFYNKAENALGEKKKDSITYSYFKGLQSLIYRLKMFRTQDATAKTDLNTKALQELNNAIDLNPNNPVLWVLSATDSTLDHQNSKGHRLTSVALLRDAKEEFKKIKNRNKSDITYWNEHWITPWLKGLTPKNMKQ